MEEYSNTELFKEIIHFIDIKYPEWKTNNGIGFWAGEFVCTVILNNEYLQDRDEYSFREMCETLYKELDVHYNKTKSSFDFIYKDVLFRDFEIKYDEELEENEHLSEAEYSVFYDNLYADFKKEHLKIVTYNFKDDLIL